MPDDSAATISVTAGRLLNLDQGRTRPLSELMISRGALANRTACWIFVERDAVTDVVQQCARIEQTLNHCFKSRVPRLSPMTRPSPSKIGRDQPWSRLLR